MRSGRSASRTVTRNAQECKGTACRALLLYHGVCFAGGMSRNRLRLLLLLSSLALSQPLFAQDICKWQDEKGQWNFSDRAQSEFPQEKLKLEPPTPYLPPPEIPRAKTPPPEERPELEITGHEFKVTRRTNSWWWISWKVEVINSGREDKLINLNVRFLDDDGFVVGEDSAYRQLARSGNRVTFQDYIIIAPNDAVKISKANAKITSAIARVRE